MKQDVEIQAFANEMSIDGKTGPTGGLGQVMSQFLYLFDQNVSQLHFRFIIQTFYAFLCFLYIYIYVVTKNQRINNKFIPTRFKSLKGELFTKQACRDELEVYILGSIHRY